MRMRMMTTSKLPVANGVYATRALTFLANKGYHVYSFVSLT